MKVIAHRGASGEFPENTLLAFEQALVQGADGIELDVRYHHSGQFFLLHDNELNVISNGQGNFDHLSVAQLQQLDAGSGQQIPSLTQALKLINGRCQVNIELKSNASSPHDIAKLLMALQQQLDSAVEQYQFSWSHFLISSFNHHLVAAQAKLLPPVATAALIASIPLGYSQFALDLAVCAINPSIDCLNQALVHDAHQRGLLVWVYTVDKQQDIANCYAMGVDAIFTNYPARSRHYIEQLKQTTPSNSPR